MIFGLIRAHGARWGPSGRPVYLTPRYSSIVTPQPTARTGRADVRSTSLPPRFHNQVFVECSLWPAMRLQNERIASHDFRGFWNSSQVRVYSRVIAPELRLVPLKAVRK